jgi:hypothetical protein
MVDRLNRKTVAIDPRLAGNWSFAVARLGL